MKAGDLVRWKKSGKICVYLGIKWDGGHANDMIYMFHSAEFGYVDRWSGTFNLRASIEVVNESR